MRFIPVTALAVGLGILVCADATFAQARKKGKAAKAAAPAATQPVDEGAPPTGKDNEPLNFDFETGTLKDWTASGEAFANQPVKGDTVAPRRPGMKSGHQKQYWIGTYENGLGDQPKGTLISAPFKVTQPWAGFLVGGGRGAGTRVELVRAKDNSVFLTATGSNREEMRRVVVDVRREIDTEIFIRLVDDASGGWGHINFDDFRFYARKPPNADAADPEPLKMDEVKFAGLSADEAAKAMTLPQGFAVTACAAEPDVQQPVAMAIDDRGRVWVAEAHSYPQKRPEGQGKDKILIFEDNNGDGKFDKRTVFMEGLNLVSGMEVGFGGVWVGQAPQLLFVPIDASGEKPAGKPQVVLDGFGYQDTHETLNAFNWGPDGWLYGCHGVFTHSLVGKPGTPDDQRIKMNAAVWRYHPTKRLFEVFAEGASNQWGVDWNDHGQAFMTACVIPHLYHVIQGARYQRQAGPHIDPYTYQDIKTIADHVHWAGTGGPHAGNNRSDAAGGGHAHCGAMIYLGGAWPEKYRNSLFMSNIHGNRVNNDLLEPRGSGYVGHHGADFAFTNDKWSRWISIKYGPDGNCYVIDWYDKQACHLKQPEVWDRSNGRVYKISYNGSSSGATEKPLDLSKLSSEELVKLQLHPNDWYVRHARRLLQERGDDRKAQAALANIAKAHPDATRRLRAMWALHVTGGLTQETLTERLKDENPYVRAWAIQLAAEDGKVPPDTLRKWADLAANDPSAVVRLYLASAMQRVPTADRWDVLKALSRHAEDADDHNLPLMVWYALEPMVAENAGKALAIAAGGKMPLLREFAARRMAAISAAQ